MKILTTLMVLFLAVPALAEAESRVPTKGKSEFAGKAGVAKHEGDNARKSSRLVEKAKQQDKVDSDLTPDQLDQLANIWAQLIGQREVGEIDLEKKIAKLKKKQKQIERKLEKLVERLEEQNTKKLIGEVRKNNERIDLRPIQGAVDSQELMKLVIEALSRSK